MAVLSVPIATEVALPELLSPAIGRTVLALWAGVARWTPATAAAEWRGARADSRADYCRTGRVGVIVRI